MEPHISINYVHLYIPIRINNSIHYWFMRAVIHIWHPYKVVRFYIVLPRYTYFQYFTVYHPICHQRPPCQHIIAWNLQTQTIYNFLQSHQQPPASGQRRHKKHKPTGYTRDSYHSHIILAPPLFYTIPVYQLHQHPIGLHYRIRAILLLDTHGAHYNVPSRIPKSSGETPHGSKPLR